MVAAGIDWFLQERFLKAAYGIHASRGTRTSMYIAQELFAVVSPLPGPLPEEAVVKAFCRLG